MFHELAPGLHVRSDPLRIIGMELGHRMTVVCLPGDDLWIHSPVACTAEVLGELRALGTPRVLVVPSLLHDLYLGDWLGALPDAESFAPSGMDVRHPEWRFDRVLGEGTPPAWSDVLPHVEIAGMPRAREHVFFHRPSRTLVLADLAFCLTGPQSLLGRAMLSLFGAYGGLRTSRLFRRLIKDKAAFRSSIREVLEWDFERVVLGHGENLDPERCAEFRAHLERLSSQGGGTAVREASTVP